MNVRKTEQRKIWKQTLNDCSYVPIKPNTLQMQDSIISIINPHEYCLHNHYCILNQNRINLESQIMEVEKKLNDFKNIKDAAINGEIIYHEELDGYYDIEVSEYTDLKGKKHFKTGVGLKDNFIGAVNRKIVNAEYDLKGLLNFRLDVIHGKIGGYGYV